MSNVVSTLLTDLATSSPACLPRWATPRRERKTLGPQVCEIARLLGTPFMPWQEFVVNVALELLPDGSFAYREVICTVPRQQGKTTKVLSLEVWRANAYARIVNRRQRIYYSAQTGKDGRQKLLDDQAPIIQASPLAELLDNRRANGGIRRESGGEGIDFKGGSRIDVMASSIESGHGKTIDLGILDEAFADVDDRREQAMIPAMMTKRDAQLWVTSTAGWEGSTYLKRKVDAGRAAVADNLDTGICFFEWSADPDAAVDDPATWYGCMPALGITINEQVVMNALRTMEPEEFERAFLNRWTTGEARVIPKEVWDAVNGEHKPDGGFCFGVDAAPDRSWASIVVVDSTSRGELIEHREGVTWMIDRLAELGKKYDATVAIDVKGPAASLIPDLETVGVRLEKFTADRVANATARIYDAIADRQIKIRRHPDLDTAAAGARKRISGEKWYWGRTSASVDISPLVALTLAYDLAVSLGRTPEVWAAWG